MTSHLYHITNGPQFADTTSHSRTRRILGIADHDETYAEVEWYANKPLSIRFPYSWGETQCDDCRGWYASRFSTADELARYVIIHSTRICIEPDHFHVLAGIAELPKCTTLDCSRCMELETLPALPECIELYCVDCIGLKALPTLPECVELHCIGCTGLKVLPVLPKCVELYCIGCTGLKVLPALPKCIVLCCADCTGLENN